tara:strand:+ start:128 stop:817 length:690 start_codon:yes stop_codon:yes gene_type:complete
MSKILALAGASVILVARRQELLDGVAQDVVKQGGNAATCSADLTQLSEIELLLEEGKKPFGPPDVLINAAGVNLREPADKISWKSWNKTLMINLSVPFFLAQGFVPGMKKKGNGRIINIASMQSFRAFPNGMAYGASKGGVTQLTRAMAEAWSESNICVNAIAPGFFPTDLTAPVFSDSRVADHHASMTAIGRNGRLEDFDGITVFLASRSSQYITGQIIPVDGGYTAK